MKNFFQNNNQFFVNQLNIRKRWLNNKRDYKAEKDWEKIKKKINSDKRYNIVQIAYNFSKNMHYEHPGLKSYIYFYHPLRVCILSTKIKEIISPNLMALCLLHNIFETTNIDKEIVKKIFGKKIVSQLEILTVDRNRENKENYKKNYYFRLAKAGDNVIFTKIFDKLDNLYLLRNNKNLKIKKNYLSEIKKFVLPMIDKKSKNLLLHFLNLISFSKIN